MIIIHNYGKIQIFNDDSLLNNPEIHIVIMSLQFNNSPTASALSLSSFERFPCDTQFAGLTLIRQTGQNDSQ